MFWVKRAACAKVWKKGGAPGIDGTEGREVQFRRGEEPAM